MALPGRPRLGSAFRTGEAPDGTGERSTAHEGLRGLLGMHDPGALPVHREGDAPRVRRPGRCGRTSSTGHTCCPEGTLVKANDPDAFYATAARNLALVGARRPRPRDPVQRLLLHLQGDAAPPHRRTGASATAINGRLAAEGLALHERLQVLHLAEWLRRRRWAPGVAAAAESTSGACGSPCTTAATCCGPSRPCSWDDPLHPHEGRGARDGARGARGRLPHQDAVLRRRPRPGGRARRVAGLRPPQAARPRRARRRRPRRRLPELLPAVRPQPGGAAARRRGRRRPGAVPLRAARPRPTATRRRRSAWACTASASSRSSSGGQQRAADKARARRDPSTWRC